MNMYTVSLELAKKLKEAGWHQAGEHFLSENVSELPRYAAPTIGELLEALPKCKLQKHPTDGGYYAWIPAHPFGHPTLKSFSADPADAFAELWLSLQSKNLLKK